MMWGILIMVLGLAIAVWGIKQALQEKNNHGDGGNAVRPQSSRNHWATEDDDEEMTEEEMIAEDYYYYRDDE